LFGVGAMMIALFYLSDYLRGDFRRHNAVWLTLLIKTVIAGSFPLVLLALNFYDERERRRLGEIRQLLSVKLIRRRLSESWVILVASGGAVILLGWLMLVGLGHGG